MFRTNMTLYQKQLQPKCWALLSRLRQMKHELGPSKKDKYRRKGKGRRCCLGDRIFQLLAALAVLHHDYLKNRMNCTRMISRKGWIHPNLQNFPSAKQLHQLFIHIYFCLHPKCNLMPGVRPFILNKKKKLWNNSAP